MSGTVKPFALNRREQRGVHVEIDRVAKLVRLAGRCGFHAGGQMRRIVSSQRTLAQTSEQISERFVTKKIETLFSDFETCTLRGSGSETSPLPVRPRCRSALLRLVLPEVSDSLLQPAARSTGSASLRAASPETCLRSREHLAESDAVDEPWSISA